jgi:hypothetical protein
MTMVASSLAPALPATDNQMPELHWDVDAGALRLPCGGIVDLRHRIPLRRIVTALVRQLRSSPGTPVTARDLVAAGWPGERLLPCAATNRLYVALATLRSLGMRGVLRRGRGGWLLDPELRPAGATEESVVTEGRMMLRLAADPVCAW